MIVKRKRTQQKYHELVSVSVYYWCSYSKEYATLAFLMSIPIYDSASFVGECDIQYEPKFYML